MTLISKKAACHWKVKWLPHVCIFGGWLAASDEATEVPAVVLILEQAQGQKKKPKCSQEREGIDRWRLHHLQTDSVLSPQSQKAQVCYHQTDEGRQLKCAYVFTCSRTKKLKKKKNKLICLEFNCQDTVMLNREKSNEPWNKKKNKAGNHHKATSRNNYGEAQCLVCAISEE